MNIKRMLRAYEKKRRLMKELDKVKSFLKDFNVPKWLVVRLSKLQDNFGNKQFTTAEAKKVLKSGNSTAVILNYFCKMGLVERKEDKNDLRKSKYKVVV